MEGYKSKPVLEKDPVRNGLEMKIETGEIYPESKSPEQYNLKGKESKNYSDNSGNSGTKFK